MTATVKELMEVEGIGKASAAKIRKTLDEPCF
jgi:ERCC4-type nuclease